MTNNYRYIHPEVKNLLISQSMQYKQKRLASNLSMHRSTVYRVLKLWGQTGMTAIQRSGRPRDLSGLDCAVSSTYQSRSNPDQHPLPHSFSKTALKGDRTSRYANFKIC